jgi:hypothetical protein
MAATGYVSSSGDTRKVSRSGDTMTGDLVLADSTPDTPTSAASKGYTDTTAADTVAAHVAENDAHGDRAAAAAALSAHAGASDPHLDRAYADTKFATLAALSALDGTVNSLAVTVGNVDIFVNDCLTRVSNIEQGSAFLAGAHYTAPVEITSSGMAAARILGRRTSPGPPTSGDFTANDAVLDSTGAWWLCTASGSPGTWVTPPTPGNSWLPTDQGLTAWTFDPASCGASGTTLSAGFIYLGELILRQAATINRVHAVLGSAGSGLSAGQCLAGLYDSSGTRVGITADQSTAWASAGNKAMSLTTPYAAAAGRYYMAMLFNGSSSPSFACGSTHGATFTPGNANLAVGAYRFCRSASGQTALPASIALSGYTPDANNVWAAAS